MNLNVKSERFFQRSTKYLKKVFAKKLHKVIDFLENNNKSNPEINGEYVFIDIFIKNCLKEKKDLVIFDIGANIGEYTKHLIEKISKENKGPRYNIYLFEPTEISFAKLKDNFANQENVFLNNYALSDVSGEESIFYDKQGSGLASLYERNLSYYDIALDKSETVIVKTLKDFIESNKFSTIDLMKIDVEGNELKVLKGMDTYLNKDFVNFVQFEYGGTNLDAHTSLADFYSLLEPRGFKIAKIMSYGLDFKPYDPSMDNFKYSNYVAVSERLLK